MEIETKPADQEESNYPATSQPQSDFTPTDAIPIETYTVHESEAADVIVEEVYLSDDGAAENPGGWLPVEKDEPTDDEAEMATSTTNGDYRSAGGWEDVVSGKAALQADVWSPTGNENPFLQGLKPKQTIAAAVLQSTKGLVENEQTVTVSKPKSSSKGKSGSDREKSDSTSEAEIGEMKQKNKPAKLRGKKVNKGKRT